MRQEEQFEPCGLYYTVPDWIDMEFFNGGHRYPDDLHQAFAGEKLPIAKLPDGVKFQPGDENSYAGRASFYACRYGDYLIGMNSSKEKTYTLTAPAGYNVVRDLLSGKMLKLQAGAVTVRPQSTVVLYLEAANTPLRSAQKPKE